MLGIGALFLLFVLLYSQRVASQSCETLGELLHHPKELVTQLLMFFSLRKQPIRGLGPNFGNAAQPTLVPGQHVYFRRLI